MLQQAAQRNARDGAAGRQVADAEQSPFRASAERDQRTGHLDVARRFERRASPAAQAKSFERNCPSLLPAHMAVEGNHSCHRILVVRFGVDVT